MDFSGWGGKFISSNLDLTINWHACSSQVPPKRSVQTIALESQRPRFDSCQITYIVDDEFLSTVLSFSLYDFHSNQNVRYVSVLEIIHALRDKCFKAFSLFVTTVARVCMYVTFVWMQDQLFMKQFIQNHIHNVACMLLKVIALSTLFLIEYIPWKQCSTYA